MSRVRAPSGLLTVWSGAFTAQDGVAAAAPNQLMDWCFVGPQVLDPPPLEPPPPSRVSSSRSSWRWTLSSCGFRRPKFKCSPRTTSRPWRSSRPVWCLFADFALCGRRVTVYNPRDGRRAGQILSAAQDHAVQHDHAATLSFLPACVGHDGGIDQI